MRFFDSPPAKTAPSYKILVPKGGKPLSFVSICSAYAGVYTHWYGGHTVPCCWPSPCDLCDRPIKKNFKAYVAAEALDGGTRLLVQLTHSASITLSEMATQERGLLGLRLRVQRATQRDTSMLQVSSHGYQEVGRPLPITVLHEMIERILHANAGTEINGSA